MWTTVAVIIADCIVMNAQVADWLRTSHLLWGFMYSTQREQLDIWSSNRCGCMFVSSQVDLLLMHPYFLLIVPLYVLLGRCSVILSWAGCLYDPWTEIWLARPECLSFFRFPPSLFPSPPLLRSLLSLLIPLFSSTPPFFACLPHPLCSPLKDEISSRAAPADIIFSMLNLAYPSSLLLFIFGYPAIVSAKYAVWLDLCGKGYFTVLQSEAFAFFSLLEPPYTLLMLVRPHKGACMTAVLEQLMKAVASGVNDLLTHVILSSPGWIWMSIVHLYWVKMNACAVYVSVSQGGNIEVQTSAT